MLLATSFTCPHGAGEGVKSEGRVSKGSKDKFRHWQTSGGIVQRDKEGEVRVKIG